jgi:PilZ domain
VELRRRAPRVATSGWQGKYVLEDDPQPDWAECVVLDISLIGVGLELVAGTSKDLIGHRLVVQVQSPLGNSVSLRLVGQVRNASPGQQGTRVGIEFVGLSDMEQEILRLVELLGVAW